MVDKLIGHQTPHVKFFHRNLSMMAQVWSKEAQFFAYMLSSMNSKQLVEMTVKKKKDAMAMISPDVKNPLGSAKSYMTALEKKGLLRNMRGGEWMVNPHVWGTDDRCKEINQKSAKWEM